MIEDSATLAPSMAVFKIMIFVPQENFKQLWTKSSLNILVITLKKTNLLFCYTDMFHFNLLQNKSQVADYIYNNQQLTPQNIWNKKQRNNPEVLPNAEYICANSCRHMHHRKTALDGYVAKIYWESGQASEVLPLQTSLRQKIHYFCAAFQSYKRLLDLERICCSLFTKTSSV